MTASTSCSLTTGDRKPSVVERKIHLLNGDEWSHFHDLRPFPGEAFTFWRRIAASRGLDPRTLIHINGAQFSGLPIGHGKHWCYPLPLKCKYLPDGGLAKTVGRGSPDTTSQSNGS